LLAIKLAPFSLYGSADAKAVTQSNRYLMIATSGGLNQQRTGVRANISNPTVHEYMKFQ
jgi:hypothetical protein